MRFACICTWLACSGAVSQLPILAGLGDAISPLIGSAQPFTYLHTFFDHTCCLEAGASSPGHKAGPCLQPLCVQPLIPVRAAPCSEELGSTHCGAQCQRPCYKGNPTLSKMSRRSAGWSLQRVPQQRCPGACTLGRHRGKMLASCMPAWSSASSFPGQRAIASCAFVALLPVLTQGLTAPSTFVEAYPMIVIFT